MSTTLYRAFDAQDRLLYVGIAGNVFDRLSQHRGAGWTVHTVKVTFAEYSTRDEAAEAELHAIRTEDPVWNMAGRPVERHLRWMAAYPNGDPDDVDLDAVLADASRMLRSLTAGSGAA